MNPARSALRTATQDIHMSLHSQGAVSKLVLPDISNTQYERALHALLNFYSWVEACRDTHDLWPELSVRSLVSCLERDLKKEATAATPPQNLSHGQLQGILYVAHGAGFGRTAFAKNIASALPHASCHFVSCPMNLAAWRVLTERIETHHSDMSEAIDGAVVAFSKMRQFNAEQANP